MNLVTRASLSQELLKRMPVLIPSDIEQIEIAGFLDNKTAELDDKIAKTKRIIELQKEYRTALISEAVTGKFKVPELVKKEFS
jgi:type I restriction enzyme S subunit